MTPRSRRRSEGRVRVPAFGRALGIAAALALAGALAAPAAAAPAYQDPAARMRVTQLDNGLTVLTLEDHTTPTASLQVWVEVGSGDEARWSGLAHLFEHMMFRGSKNLPPEAHGRILGARGAVVNAFTSRDVTVYFEDLPAEHLPLAIALEAERLAHLDISETSLQSEREVVIEERRLRTEDDPEGRAFEALMALAFKAHPYRVPTIGWRSDLEKVGVEEAMAFYRDYYAANNIVVVVAGDFETEEVLAQVRESFGALPHAERIPRNPTEEPAQLGERRATLRLPVRAPLVTLAWHAPAAGSEDAEALDVASEILSSGRTSRLYRRLVYDEELALAASGGFWELSRAGIFYADATLRPGASAERAEALLREEIGRLRDAPVSAEELERAKRGLEVGLVRGLRTTHALAMRLGRDWVTFGRVRPLDERLAAIRAVTVEDVQRVAGTWLDPWKLSVVHVLPEQAEPDAGAEAPAAPAAAEGASR
jgi:zinc protease